MRETNAEYLRRLREIAKSNGMCSTCRARPAKEGRKTCQACLDGAEKRKNAALYVRCQRCWADVRGTGKVYCARCSARKDEYQKARRERARQDGRCVCCQRATAEVDMAQCLACAEEARLRVLARNRLAGAKATAKCRVCKQLGIESVGHDHRSHDRWMAAREGWRT